VLGRLKRKKEEKGRLSPVQSRVWFQRGRTDRPAGKNPSTEGVMVVTADTGVKLKKILRKDEKKTIQ